MATENSSNITQLLMDWSNGNNSAFEQLMPLVYDELRVIAKRFMRRQSAGHTFQTTELIHEAYLKISAKEDKEWQNREHFFGVAASAMRHILVDYARSKNRQKRGGMLQKITFEEGILAMQTRRNEEIIELDEALKRLAEFDIRKSKVVEMKFFGGLKIEEIAVILKISPETVKRDWSFAKSWLARELSRI